MNRRDKIKLALTRNWKFPGKERLARLLKPTVYLQKHLQNGITWLNDEPLAIYTSADNYIECAILGTGTYEQEIEKLISVSLKEGDTALDIGANIGLQSLRMARYAGKTGQVLCFEPLQYLQEKLLKNIALNGFETIKLLPYALSNHETELPFSINKNAWNQGTFSIGQNGTGGIEQIVRIKIADDLPEINQLTCLQLIKIDVEGFELNVLKGLANTIRRCRPRLIFEYDENYWKQNNQLISECFSFLNEFNYSIFQIFPAGCELIQHPYATKSGNLFCIPK